MIAAKSQDNPQKKITNAVEIDTDQFRQLIADVKGLL
jgi:hypothetical protein